MNRANDFLEDDAANTIDCDGCGRPFIRRRSWAKFCSKQCRMLHHQIERKEAVEEYREMKRQRFETKDGE